jgi:hypothetical protein
MHPLLQLLMAQPGLLGEHAQAYAELLVSECSALKHAALRRLLWTVAMAFLALAGVVLAGVSLMLWAALPGLPEAAARVLLVTPAVPLGAALACLLRLHWLAPASAFANIQEQFKADLQVLQEVNAP